MTISKEQWKQIEAELSHTFGSVDLVCDSYRVSAVVKQAGVLKQNIVVYVDGWIKGEWMTGDNERASKFYRETKRYLYSAKKRADAQVQAKKRGTPAILREWFESVATSQSSSLTPFWNNPKAFCRQLRKTCTAVDLVKIGYGV